MPQWPEFPDPSAMIDQAAYNLWIGVAVILWGIDRALLMLAYQLGQLRHTLVNTAFLSAYKAMVEQVVDPLITPLATLALLIFLISLMLLPLFTEHAVLGNVRQIILLAVLVPALLIPAGQVLIDLDTTRVSIGSQLASVLRGPGGSGISANIFGASPATSDMPEPRALYPVACNGKTLERPALPGNTTQPHMMDDMAAALLWADARDIHCPSLDEGRPTLPAQFYQPTPGYADANALRGMDDASLRAGQIARTQQGINRLTLGIVPSVLAVLEALVQLIFSLSLMVLWASLPIALLFMLFQRDTGALTRLFQQGLDILKASWAGSFVLGLIFVCVEQTARLGNATAYIGFSIGSLVVTAYVASLAAGTVRQGFAAFGSVAGAATGLSLGGLGQIAGGAARVALGGAAGAAQGVAGGVGGAVQASIAGHAAMEASGSSRYARAARLGTIKPIAQLGEVAAAMGLLKDEEIRAGLYAGSRADGKGDFRAMRRQIDADQKTKLADGTTIGERATARAIAHQMRPSKRERLDDAVTRARNAAGAFADGELFQAAQDAGDRMGGKVLGAADRARATVQSAQRGIAGAARNPRRAAALDRQESVTSAAAARPDPRRTAVRLDGNRLVAAERRAPDSQGVTTETDLQAVNPSLLSARGYTWQYNTDDDDAIASVSYWKNEAPTASKGAGGPGVARMPLPRRAVARRQRDDESPLARQSREAQAQHAEVSTAAPSVLESTPEPQPRATEQARIARLQEAHAALSEQRHALAAGEAEGDADYHRMKLELREQELISDGLSDPATAGQVQTQIDIATYESRAAALNRESVVAATEAEELPPASDRATWKVQHRAQRRTARIERERTEVQQQIARRKRELGFTQATQRASAPQFRPEALRAAGELQQPDPAPKKATRS